MCIAIDWFSAPYDFFKDFSGPTATVIAAIVAVRITSRLGKDQLRIAEEQKNIASEQTRLADVRLQHDLFEKRIAVFDAVRDLILEVFRASDISDVGWNAFMR